MNLNTPPPEWYAGAREGDERHRDGQAWWVRQVDSDGAIHWARSPYGKVVAVALRDPTKHQLEGMFW